MLFLSLLMQTTSSIKNHEEDRTGNERVTMLMSHLRPTHSSLQIRETSDGFKAGYRQEAL
jgi:hypothetical protein